MTGIPIIIERGTKVQYGYQFDSEQDLHHFAYIEFKEVLVVAEQDFETQQWLQIAKYEKIQ